MTARLNVFAVLDRKAGFYMPPFFLPSIGQAHRAMKDQASDPSTTLARHPGDFALYHLGTWDDETARFELFNLPQHLGDGEAYLPSDRGDR